MLMFCMKPEGKEVDFNHVREKVERDLKIKDPAIVKNALTKLINQGLLRERKGLFSASQKGREFFKERVLKTEEKLEKLNKSWLIVYKAKQFYPIVKDTILEFCKDRYVGFYCLFTEKRFFRRDFRGKKITIKNWKELKFYLDIHCIDIIPCVHRIGVERPDWLVVDIDAGPKVSFEKTKEITKIIFGVFKDLGLKPCLKFSGSRGFQVWALIEEFEMPKFYTPIKLKTERRERNYFSLFSDFVRVIQKEVDKIEPGITTSSVAEKEKREDKILLDPSSMKRLGLVRVPYGIHSKTGLVSMPISLKELERFEPKMAKPELVAKRYKLRGNEFKLKPSSPDLLLEKLKPLVSPLFRA